LFTQPLLALEYPIQEALGDLKSCLGKEDLSCALTGTCDACKLCKKVDSNKACKRGSALPALEGIVGVLEGHCAINCGAKQDLGKPVFQNASEGDDAVITSHSSTGGHALVFSKAGAVSIQSFSSSGKKPDVGTKMMVDRGSIASPVKASLLCLQGSTNKWVKECFKGWVNCDHNIKKTERCSICSAAAACPQDTYEVLSSYFGLPSSMCSGC